jgi:hypothetical protein
MPIRFRCVYCNQLLGISRRKAGTIVRCTSCEGQLIVPNPDEIGGQGGGEERVESLDRPVNVEESARPPDVFSAADFDAFMEPLSSAGGAVVSPPAPPASRTTIAAEPPALVLSKRKLLLAVVLAIAALCASFGGGLCVGLWLR